MNFEIPVGLEAAGKPVVHFSPRTEVRSGRTISQGMGSMLIQRRSVLRSILSGVAMSEKSGDPGNSMVKTDALLRDIGGYRHRARLV